MKYEKTLSCKVIRRREIFSLKKLTVSVIGLITVPISPHTGSSMLSSTSAALFYEIERIEMICNCCSSKLTKFMVLK